MRRQDFWRTVLQLSAQVRPFVKQLAVGFFQKDGFRIPRNFRIVEFIPAPGRLFVHGFEESGERGDRFCVRLETDELRVVAVTFGFAAQDFLRQQCLTPKRDESFGVEIFRVHSPESHREKSNNNRKERKGRKKYKEPELGRIGSKWPRR